MTLRKCLTVFLILLLFSPLIQLVYADGGPNEPVKEHPWEDVKSTQPTIVKHPDFTLSVNKVYFFSVPLLNSKIFIVVVKEKSQEVVKKELSVTNVSLPRKK